MEKIDKQVTAGMVDFSKLNEAFTRDEDNIYQFAMAREIIVDSVEISSTGEARKMDTEEFFNRPAEGFEQQYMFVSKQVGVNILIKDTNVAEVTMVESDDIENPIVMIEELQDRIDPFEIIEIIDSDESFNMIVNNVSVLLQIAAADRIETEEVDTSGIESLLVEVPQELGIEEEIISDLIEEPVYVDTSDIIPDIIPDDSDMDSEEDDGHGVDEQEHNDEEVIVEEEPEPEPVEPVKVFEFKESFEDHTVKGWGVKDDKDWEETAGIEIQTAKTLKKIDASDGEQYAELDTHRNRGANETRDSNTTISKEFDTEYVDNMTISFDYSPRTGNSSSDMSFSVNDVKYNVYHDGTSDNEDVTIVENGKWFEVSIEVEVDAEKTTIEFAAEGKEDTYGALLDNISIEGFANDPANIKLADLLDVKEELFSEEVGPMVIEPLPELDVNATNDALKKVVEEMNIKSGDDIYG
jgi:hypothetical protein